MPLIIGTNHKNALLSVTYFIPFDKSQEPCLLIITQKFKYCVLEFTGKKIHSAEAFAEEVVAEGDCKK